MMRHWFGLGVADVSRDHRIGCAHRRVTAYDEYLMKRLPFTNPPPPHCLASPTPFSSALSGYLIANCLIYILVEDKLCNRACNQPQNGLRGDRSSRGIFPRAGTVDHVGSIFTRQIFSRNLDTWGHVWHPGRVRRPP